MKTEYNEYKLIFVDFEYSDSTPISPNVFEIKGELINTIGITEDYTSLYNFIVSNFLELGLQSFNKLDDINKEKFSKKIESDDSGVYVRKLISRMNFVSNNIAIEGRIGPANFIIGNSNNIKYLDYYCSFATFVTKVIHDGILKDDEIIMGRKNQLDQTGVVFIYQIDGKNINYSIINTGLSPTKQFMCFNF